MADTKLTALTAVTTPTNDDIMYVVDDPGGTPASKKITVVNFAIYVWNYLTSLTAKASLTGADQFSIADSAASNAAKKVTFTTLLSYVWDNLTNLTAKTTLADADQVSIADSAASNVAKKITWANVMVAILAYTGTLTNKRVTPRVVTVTVSATPTYNTDNGDVFRIGVGGSLLNTAITSMVTNKSGTPTHGEFIEFEFLDDGTARAITWGADFRSTSAGTLPTTTTISKLLRVLFQWDSADSKWDCVGVATES